MPVHYDVSLTASMQFARNNEISVLETLFTVSSGVSLMWFCSEWTDSML
jgi:hypothetical protein